MTTPSSSTSRKAAARAARIWLKATWPVVVGTFQPLAIGTREVAVAAAAGLHSPRAVHDALRAHTACPRYRAALARPGAVRVDLDGAIVEPVSPEHQTHADAPRIPSGTAPAVYIQGRVVYARVPEKIQKSRSKIRLRAREMPPRHGQ